MSTLAGRTATALLVIDMQNGVVAEAHERDAVATTIAGLVDQARAAGTPVVWVQHSAEDLPSGSAEWQYIPELTPEPGEPVVHKRYGDSFEDTTLAEVLAERSVGQLVVTGAQSDACIRATLHGALVRGYDTTLVADGHTTEDLRPWGSPIDPAATIAFTNMYWSHSAAPGRTAAVLPAAEVRFESTDGK